MDCDTTKASHGGAVTARNMSIRKAVTDDFVTVIALRAVTDQSVTTPGKADRKPRQA